MLAMQRPSMYWNYEMLVVSAVVFVLPLLAEPSHGC